jgi:hypothetical protein
MIQFFVGLVVGAVVGRRMGAMYGDKIAVKRNASAVHGELMEKVHDPNKLMRAAQIFGAEGLKVEAAQLATKARQVSAQAKGAAELVEGSRAGDQHATAQIAEIRKNAARGVPRARVSCILIEEYCRNVPYMPPPEVPGVPLQSAA